MIKIENLVTPSPENFNVVIRGMRSPFKSWDKSDSQLCDPYNYYLGSEYCKSCNFKWTNECDDPFIYCGFVLGNKDKQLLLNLCKAGDPSHRKVLRQLPIICEIKAPLYWWKQADKYQVGTVTNSESTMNTMTKYPFKVEDFSIKHFFDIDYEGTNGLDTYMFEDRDNIDDHFIGLVVEDYGVDPKEYFEEYFVNLLNSLRQFYLHTNDKTYWYALNEILPQSYNQTRTWSGNYEVLLNMIQQRQNHPLTEWTDFSNFMLEHVPYLKEIYEAVNESKKDKE